MKKLNYIFLIALIVLSIYKTGLLNFVIETNYDIFEYLGHANTISNIGFVENIKNIKFGTTGEFPIYSKFPGFFIFISSFGLITGISNYFSIFILDILLKTLLYVFLFIYTTKIISNNKINFKIIFFIGIIFIFPIVNISSGGLAIFMFIIGLYLLLFYKKYTLGLLILYSILIFHHQTSILLAPFFLFLVIDFIKNNKNNIYVTLVFIFLFLIHLYIFILPDFGNIMNIGRNVIGDDIFKSRLDIFKNFNLIILLFGLIGIKESTIDKNKKYILLVCFFYLIFFSIYPVLFPERSFYGVVFLSLPFVLIGLLKYKFIGMLFIGIVISMQFNYSYLITQYPIFKKNTEVESIKYSIFGYQNFKNGNLNSIKYGVETKKLATVVNNNCILADIFTSFNLNNTGNIKSCYNFERPLNPIKYKDFKLYEKYPLIENFYNHYNDPKQLKHIMMQNNIKYFAFHNYYIYYNNLSKKEANEMRESFIKLEESGYFQIVDKINFKEGDFYIYKIN